MAQDTSKNGMVVPVNGGSKRAKVEESSGNAKKNENTESRVCVDGELRLLFAEFAFCIGIPRSFLLIIYFSSCLVLTLLVVPSVVDWLAMYLSYHRQLGCRTCFVSDE